MVGRIDSPSGEQCAREIRRDKKSTQNEKFYFLVTDRWGENEQGDKLMSNIHGK